MSDLIERLRRLYTQHGTNYVQEAADEIERLRIERDELRRQLAECSQMLARQAATIRELTRP
jgi:phage shock protein A